MHTRREALRFLRAVPLAGAAALAASNGNATEDEIHINTALRPQAMLRDVVRQLERGFEVHHFDPLKHGERWDLVPGPAPRHTYVEFTVGSIWPFDGGVAAYYKKPEEALRAWITDFRTLTKGKTKLYWRIDPELSQSEDEYHEDYISGKRTRNARYGMWRLYYRFWAT